MRAAYALLGLAFLILIIVVMILSARSAEAPVEKSPTIEQMQ